VLMSVLIAWVIQERFGLDSRAAADETFTISDSFPLQDNSVSLDHASGQLQPV